MKARPMRVLIADDEPHIRKLMCGMVTALGGEVVAQAGDGRQAIRLFEALRPDLVILDVNMPAMTGDEALRGIVAIDPGVIALMLTSQDTVDAVRTCLELGARDYILKSNPAERILELLAESWPSYAAEIAAPRARASC